jgi:peptidoglycan/LPS O-acetylase OafA/YrhL
MSNVEGKRGLRRIDIVAICGLTGLLIGAMLFKFGADYLPVWLAWLIAPLLWYVGAGMLVGWACARLFGSARHAANVAAKPVVVNRTATKRFASNFLEHDFDFDQAKESA